MPCDCEKTHEQDNGNGNGAPKDCPEGQTFDSDAGKCVPKSERGVKATDNGNDKDKKKKEQLGDPKTASTQPDMPATDNGEGTGDVQQVDPTTCPDGHSWDATQQICVPTDTKDPGDGQTSGTDKTASVEKSLRVLNGKVDGLMKHTEKRPTAQVSSDTRHLDIHQIAKEMLEAIREGRNYVFHIPLEFLRAINVANTKPSTGVRECYRSMPLSILEAYQQPNRVIKESYATLKEDVVITGTHATQDLDTDVGIIPGGISFVPVFQFAKVKQIEQGMDRARFFTSTLPANGSQTVGTTPGEAVQTLTSIEVTPSTITGVFLVGDYNEIENSPFDLLQAVVEGSSASYDDFVATDMLTVESGEASLTPGLWIRGDTGVTISDSDIATNTLTEEGVAFGREYLEDQGYLRGGIKPVMCLHPRQWRELVTSTEVTNLATRSVPDIWLKAQLEEFMGVQLVVTNAVENFTAQTNNAFNAIMFVPKHTYGIGVKRDVTVKFHDIGEDNQVRVNTTWRTKTGVLDAASTVRISTTAP